MFIYICILRIKEGYLGYQEVNLLIKDIFYRYEEYICISRISFYIEDIKDIYVHYRTRVLNCVQMPKMTSVSGSN